jgi:hypothetical protein
LDCDEVMVDDTVVVTEDDALAEREVDAVEVAVCDTLLAAVLVPELDAVIETDELADDEPVSD